MTVLQQLPSAPTPFVDREPVLAELERQFCQARNAGHFARLAIYGPQGIGLRSVTRSWYWRTPGRFLNGVLRVCLPLGTGTDPNGLFELLGQALVDLGVPPGDLPPTLTGRQNALLNKTHSLGLLLVLENVTNAAQVEPFLLNSPTSAVLAICRSELGMLRTKGFAPIEVGALPHEFGVELIEQMLTAEQRSVLGASADSVVRACGGQPLTLVMTGALLSVTKRWDLPELVGQLSSRGLDALDPESQEFVRNTFSLAYQQLTDSSRRAYRLVAGLYPGSVVTVEAAAALLGRPVDRVRTELKTPAELRLITQVGADRFEIHHVARWHAKDCAEQEESRQDQLDAVRRVLTWYLDAAVRHDLALSARPRIGERYRVLHEAGVALPTRAEALVWLEEHRATLCAAVLLAARYELDEFDGLCWQLCEALWGVCHLHGHLGDWITTHRIGLAAAARIGDKAAVARMSSQLGAALLAYGDLPEAEQRFGEALRLADELGDGSGAQSALEWLGKIAARRGRYAEALELFDRSWRVTESKVPPALRPRTFAVLRLQRARVYYAGGRHAEAFAALDPAVDYFAESGEGDNLAKTLGLRAYVLADGEWDSDRGAGAAECAIRAAELFRSDNSLRGEAWVHELLRRLGHPGSTTRLREIYLVLGDPRGTELD
jgi:tetratricopeptide (TPR) repeat protein